MPDFPIVLFNSIACNKRAVGREIDRIQETANDREVRNGEDGDDVEYYPDDGRYLALSN